MMQRTLSGETLDRRLSFQRDQADQARRLLLRIKLGEAVNSNPLPAKSAELGGTPASHRSGSVGFMPEGNHPQDVDTRASSWPPRTARGGTLEQRAQPGTACDPLPPARADAPSPQSSTHSTPAPAPPAPGDGADPSPQPQRRLQAIVPASSFAAAAVQAQSPIAAAASASASGSLQGTLSMSLGPFRTGSDPLWLATRTRTMKVAALTQTSGDLSLAADVGKALMGLCGRGVQPSKASIDWLVSHAGLTETQRTLRSWFAHPTNGPLLSCAMQNACRRGHLRDAQLLATFLRHCDWPSVMDDAPAITHIGTFIDNLEVFKAFIERIQCEEHHFTQNSGLSILQQEMGRLALQARKNMLWESMLKPKVDLLRQMIVRCGDLELLQPLLDFMPADTRHVQLKEVARGVSLNSLQSHTWLQRRLREENVPLPSRHDPRPQGTDVARIVKLLRQAYVRGMLADEVHDVLGRVRKLLPSERESILESTLEEPDGLWLSEFLALAQSAQYTVGLWGADALGRVMAQHIDRFDCALLKFGAPIAEVLLDNLEPSQARQLITADNCRAVSLALASGQAGLLAKMMGHIDDPAVQQTLLARARCFLSEDSPQPLTR